MAFQYIIVPYDGSAHAERALDHAMKLADELQAQLDVLYVDSVQSELLEQRLMIPTHELEAYFTDEQQEIQQRLNRMIEHAHPSRVNIVQGHAGKKIVRYATNAQADLIVIGSRGLSSIQEWMLGSVSHYVAQHAECAVLIIK